ncbi:aldo/keto reductase [Streptomyces echinoruber]|uniref:Oxidoreductase n=1 Tax=Streptomyces echinoruber TaxID=68898 RepID=A0A918QV31_9ACTN|nr:aldo/keto reductase [Streptomyces echinoruber]GGZ73547.1 oxidoreductase [Streptomyces echinoruber]
MTPTPPAGTLTLAGTTVSRLGYGTMRLTGPGTWGDPADTAQAVALLRSVVHEHGITHIDTADAYGPHTVEHLVRQALHPYPANVVIATKVGMIRPGPNVWRPLGRPDYLRAAVEQSLRRLGTDCLTLCYLHRIDPTVPFLDQIGALADLQQEGKIAHIGLSKVTPAQIDLAGTVIDVAAVQNKLNPAVPDDAAITVEHCRTRGIPYIPYAPLGAGALAHGGGAVTALRWLLDLGPHIAPIPGTTSQHHLKQLTGHG